MLDQLARALEAADAAAVVATLADDVTLRVAVVMFSAQVAAHPGQADGLLVVRPDRGGSVADLTVFLRPLAALQALADEMGRRLGELRPGNGA